MTRENVYRSLLPIFYCSKMFALCTFRVSSSGYEKSILAYVYPVFFLTLFIYQCFKDFTTLEVEGDFLFVVLDRIQTVESVLNSIASYICGMMYSKRMIKWSNQVHEFDEVMKISFKNACYDISHRKMRIFNLISSWTITLYCLSLLVADAICFFPTTASIGNLNGILTYTLPIFTSSLVVLQFSGGMLVMRDRFRWINGEIENVARIWKKQSGIRKLYVVEMGKSEDPNSWCNEEKIIDILENLRRKYYNLHFLTEELNTIFGIPAALTILQAFLSLVVYILYFLKNIGMNTWVKNILYRYFCVGILLTSSFQILTLSYVSDWLSKEAKTAGSILHEIENMSEEINDFVKHFSYQIMALEIEITACHLFQINKTLVYKIVALVTNYLVVCIQFDI